MYPNHQKRQNLKKEVLMRLEEFEKIPYTCDVLGRLFKTTTAENYESIRNLIRFALTIHDTRKEEEVPDAV